MNNQKFKTIGISILQVVVITAVLFFLVNYFFYPFTVDGGSMDNTLKSGDVMYGVRYDAVPKELKNGDIVCIEKVLYGETENMVKRVIAIPGDYIQVLGNDVFLNGEKLEEDYIAEPMAFNWGDMEFHLQKGEYFVMGDNRNNSGDSREYGLVYDDEINAYVSFRLSSKESPENSLSFVK